MPDVDFLTLDSNVHSLQNTIQDATNPLEECQTKKEESTKRSTVPFWIAGGCTIVFGISTAVCFIKAKKN